MKHDWEYKKLGDICDKGSSNISLNKIEDNIGEYALFGASGYVKDIDFYHNETPYIGIVKDGSGCGRVNIYPAKSSLVGTMQYIYPKQNCDIKFLMYLLQSLDLSSLVTGAAIPHIYFKDYSNFSIPLPPLSTQQSIVSELDSLSKIIADCKETLKDYDALEQSIFYDMFGDPVKNDKGWEVKKVEDIGSCCSGGTPSRSHPEYFEGDIIWYSAGELNDLYLGESIEKITESALNNSSAKLCKAGSLFVGMYDTAAFKMGIATVDSCSNQACANVTLNDNNNVIWLYFTLLFMKEEALKNRHGARQKNLNLGYIKNFNIPVPPLPLQQQFASKIEAIEQMKEETKKTLQEAETLFQARMDYWFG